MKYIKEANHMGKKTTRQHQIYYWRKKLWGSFFGQYPGPSISKDLGPSSCCFKGIGLSSLQLNGLITNQVVHKTRILQYTHTSKQEIYMHGIARNSKGAMW